MTAITAGHRERLNLIRQRTKNARGRRQHARQQIDAARDVQDREAEAVAQIAYDQADEELQVAERLESQMLAGLAGVDSGVSSGFLSDPTTVGQLEQLAHSSLPV